MNSYPIVKNHRTPSRICALLFELDPAPGAPAWSARPARPVPPHSPLHGPMGIL